MSAFRPLPPRPNLEFEHKEAKAFLHRLRAGDPAELTRARARHPAIASAPARIRLADAQLVIAREYGFASWPKLVRYFGEADRQRYHSSIGRPDSYNVRVRSLLVEHRDRRTWAGRALACYVPRFYGMRVEDVFASAVTEDETRLTIARAEGFPSWDVLLEEVPKQLRQQEDTQPFRLAGKAMEAADLEELKRVVEAHPELLHPTGYKISMGARLLRSALHHERRQGATAMRPIIEWLTAQGLDVQLELNRQLCGHMHITTEKARWLLARGADPNWIPPNGIPVLEHAIISYWNAEAVDLVAARVVPRKALWISAGLGDVDGVRRSLDRHGKPTRAAWKLRPDFAAVGPLNMMSPPDPDDEEILMEAFLVAMLNTRTAVLEYMVSRGLPLDSTAWGSPLIMMAVGNLWTPVVECLVRCGANLDLRGWRPEQSARELARELLQDAPNDAQRRRIGELCGVNTDGITA